MWYIFINRYYTQINYSDFIRIGIQVTKYRETTDDWKSLFLFEKAPSFGKVTSRT